MNPNISNLVRIAQKHERIIIGLMSGTSVDGLDVALCKISGSGTTTKVDIIHFTTVEYQTQFKEKVASIFSKKHVNLEAVCLINEWIGIQHAKMINDCLQKWHVSKDTVDLIASHGQTIYHAPQWMHKQTDYNNATLQIGDGDHIAVNTGIITISDFRQKHIAAGGEGAPLAVYGDYLIFGKKGENRVLLNMGGIANFTYLPESMDMDAVFSTDVGPGNTIMDAYCKAHFQINYDKDAAIALSGNINQALLSQLLKHSFIAADFPKTTGPELFNLAYLNDAQKITNTTQLNHEDVMATLNCFSARVITDSIKKSFTNDEQLHIYSSGGGVHNPMLMQQIKSSLPNAQFYDTSTLNIHPDAKEAVLFAILANETVAGNNVLQSSKKELPMISMGKISFPS